jgi:hypothetical protein
MLLTARRKLKAKKPNAKLMNWFCLENFKSTPVFHDNIHKPFLL